MTTMTAKRQAKRGQAAGSSAMRSEAIRSEITRNEATGNEAKDFVKLIRELTEDQFTFWVGALNRAAAAMRAEVEAFESDERQKTISYWYLLMHLLEIYAVSRDPFTVNEGETWTSERLVSMQELTRAFKGRFKDETVRRYVFDLKARGLIVLDGRGTEAKVRLTAPAIRALTETIRRWLEAFQDVDERARKVGAIPPAAS